MTEKKLSQNVYESIEEWSQDVELVFANCKKYNGIQSEVGQIGMGCQTEFSRLIELYGVRDRFIHADKHANGHAGRDDSSRAAS